MLFQFGGLSYVSFCIYAKRSTLRLPSGQTTKPFALKNYMFGKRKEIQSKKLQTERREETEKQGRLKLKEVIEGREEEEITLED